MFQMTVESAIKINNTVSFGGSCENQHEFKNRLVDEFGNVYEVYIPLDKKLVFDDSHITLCLKGTADIDFLKGRVLKGVS